MNKPVEFMRVWDLPTRLFHWVLVVLIALQYATAEFHVLDMRWHFWFGYATLALILFRVVWGFVGSATSRFAQFVRGPRAVWAYVRAQLSSARSSSVGHNPLGGWSVLAMLICVGVQAVTGLFASDEIDTDGPFVDWVSTRTVKLMTRLHDWNQNVLLALIALHVTVVALYFLLKHENLVAPMFTGRKRADEGRILRFASAWLALGIAIFCTALVGAVVWWFGS